MLSALLDDGRVGQAGGHLPERAGRVGHRGDRADLAGHVDDPGRGRPPQQRQHRVRHRDHAEHVRLVDLAHRVEIGLAGRAAAGRDGRWTFLLAPQDVIWSDADFVRFTRSTVADLRASYAFYPGDPGIDRLVTELLALSPRFARMWAEHEVEVRGPMLKHVLHPLAGPNNPLEFECQVLHIAETGQRLIAYCAAPGSATEAAFAELAARAPLPA
jgi:MmyB-like transcription regulator ligand binding domain